MDTKADYNDGSGELRNSLSTSPGKQRHRVLRTGAVFLSCAIMGMYTNILGPSLLDIGYFTGTTTKTVTTIFIWRYSGYLVCSLLIGPIIDRINEYFLIGVSFIGMATAACLTPWWPQLSVFYAMFTLGGISSCMGSINTVTAVIMIWAADSDAYQQAGFFARSVGTALSPQIFRPFLMSTAADPITSMENITSNLSESDVRVNDSANVSLWNTTLSMPHAEPRFQFGYLIIGMALLCGSIMNFLIFLFDGNALWRANQKDTKIRSDRYKLKGKSKIIALVMQFIIVFLLACIEETFGGLLMAFHVKYLKWTEKKASDMNSWFFASCAVSRLLGIPVARVMPASRALGLQVCLILAGFITLAVAVRAHWVVPWASVLLVGLGFGSSYASMINWSNTYVVLRGRETSVFFISVALGRMTSPPFVAFLFEQYNPMWFARTGLVYSSSIIVVYFIKYAFVSHMLAKEKKYVEHGTSGKYAIVKRNENGIADGEIVQ